MSTTVQEYIVAETSRSKKKLITFFFFFISRFVLFFLSLKKVGWEKRERWCRCNSENLLERFCLAASHVSLLAQKSNHMQDPTRKAVAESLKTGVVFIIAFSYESDHYLGIDIFEYTC